MCRRCRRASAQRASRRRTDRAAPTSPIPCVREDSSSAAWRWLFGLDVQLFHQACELRIVVAHDPGELILRTAGRLLRGIGETFAHGLIVERLADRLVEHCGYAR